MNKNKLIFAIIGGIILILIVIGILSLKSGSKQVATKRETGTFKIWIVGDSKKSFDEFLSSFKTSHKEYSTVEYIVQSFPNYEEYSRALNSAIIKGVAPDIFVLNNNETSLFEEKILPLPNSVINISNFRKNYKGVFNDDLIISNGELDDNGNTKEFLKGVPVGYETLGIFYNRRFRFKVSDFTSLASLNSAISRVKEMNIIPLAAGNGGTVLDSPDILAQFFLLHKVKGLAEAEAQKVKQALGEYVGFGSVDGENSYNELYEEAIITGKDNIDLFVEKEVAAIVAYPRIIKRLEALGFSKNTLFATPFPHFYGGDGASLANYNYFVVNNETDQQGTALAFMSYLNSDEGSTDYLNKYKYYLPARLSLESDMGEQKMSGYFENIVLSDFYSDEPLSSFNKGSKVIFDRELIPVLDDFTSYLSSFENFKTSTLCKVDKLLFLKDLATSCDK